MVTLQDLQLYEGQVVYGVVGSGNYHKFYTILSDREQGDYDLPEMSNITGLVRQELDYGMCCGMIVTLCEGAEIVRNLSRKVFGRDDYLRYQEL